MNPDTFKIRLKCPDSQTLLHLQQDFPLRWHQRLALRGHLWACQACTSTSHNVNVLREQLQRWRAQE